MTEKNNLISEKTLKDVETVEQKIKDSLLRFAAKYECSLNELSIRIVGREDNFPIYAVYKNTHEKLAIITVGEFIKLNAIERLAVNENKINETIYRSLSKIVLGADDPVKINNITIIISVKSENDKPNFVLYKNNNLHKKIESWSIL